MIHNNLKSVFNIHNVNIFPFASAEDILVNNIGRYLTGDSIGMEDLDKFAKVFSLDKRMLLYDINEQVQSNILLNKIDKDVLSVAEINKYKAYIFTLLEDKLINVKSFNYNSSFDNREFELNLIEKLVFNVKEYLGIPNIHHLVNSLVSNGIFVTFFDDGNLPVFSQKIHIYNSKKDLIYISLNKNIVKDNRTAIYYILKELYYIFLYSDLDFSYLNNEEINKLNVMSEVFSNLFLLPINKLKDILKENKLNMKLIERLSFEYGILENNLLRHIEAIDPEYEKITKKIMLNLKEKEDFLTIEETINSLVKYILEEKKIELYELNTILEDNNLYLTYKYLDMFLGLTRKDIDKLTNKDYNAFINKMALN